MSDGFVLRQEDRCQALPGGGNLRENEAYKCKIDEQGRICQHNNYLELIDAAGESDWNLVNIKCFKLKRNFMELISNLSCIL